MPRFAAAAMQAFSTAENITDHNHKVMFPTMITILWIKQLFYSIVLCIQLYFQKPFKVVQVDWIELSEALHPDRRIAQCIGLQHAPDDAAATLLPDQPGIGQDRKMFGNCGQADLKRRGDIRDRHVVLQQHAQNGPPCRIGEGGENLVKMLGLRGHRFVVQPFS